MYLCALNALQCTLAKSGTYSSFAILLCVKDIPALTKLTMNVTLYEFLFEQNFVPIHFVTT